MLQKFLPNNRIVLCSGLILLAAVSRLLPHWPNVTAVAAMGLFAGSRLPDKRLAFILPLLALWVSDVILNNVLYGAWVDHFTLWYPGMAWVYAAFLVVVAMGVRFLRHPGVARIVGASLAASTVFFLLSNFGVWSSGTLYPATFSGLLATYAAALPFFANTLGGDLFYCTVLFGAHAWVQARQAPAALGA